MYQLFSLKKSWTKTVSTWSWRLRFKLIQTQTLWFQNSYFSHDRFMVTLKLSGLKPRTKEDKRSPNTTPHFFPCCRRPRGKLFRLAASYSSVPRLPSLRCPSTSVWAVAQKTEKKSLHVHVAAQWVKAWRSQVRFPAHARCVREYDTLLPPGWDGANAEGHVSLCEHWNHCDLHHASLLC